MPYNNKLVKSNGFPTRYGYNCGYGKSELVILPNDETCKVSLMPNSNSLD